MLHPESLYIVLHSQYRAGSYHWGLYYHRAGGTRRPYGRKFHIKNEGTGRWMADYQDSYGVLRSNFLIGLIRIATIPTSRFDYMKSLIESTPLNTPGITCRVWVLNAIQSLMDAGLVRSWHWLTRERSTRFRFD